jgi:hypothetical protein
MKRWLLILAHDGTPLTDPMVYDGQPIHIRRTFDTRGWKERNGSIDLIALTWNESSVRMDAVKVRLIGKMWPGKEAELDIQCGPIASLPCCLATESAAPTTAPTTSTP